MIRIVSALKFWYLLVPFFTGIIIQEFLQINYQTATVSAISSVLLGIVLLVHTYIYPKKKLSFFTILVLISLLPVISMFRSGIYESGDFTIHIYRSIEFYRSLSEGHILPSWAAGLNETYGYPLFIFNYTLPYYLICLFHFLGLSFVSSLKVFLGLNFILSGIFMYIVSKKLFKNDLSAFLTSIFYLFAPYHLIDIHYGIAVGEVLIFTIMPALFYLLILSLERRNLIIFGSLSLATLLLITSHVLMGFLVIGLFGFYFLFSYPLLQNFKISAFIFSSLLLGFLGSVYIWLAPIILTKYTIMANLTESVQQFPSSLFTDLIYSPWKYGFLFQGPLGQINSPLGYAQIACICIAIYMIFTDKIQKKYRNNILFWTISLAIVLFFLSPFSIFIWKAVDSPILSSLPHRLNIFAAFLTSIIAGFIVIFFNRRRAIILALIFIAIFSTILNWGQRRVIESMGDYALISNLPNSTKEAEGHWYANTRWRSFKNQWFQTLPKSHIAPTNGKIDIKELRRNSTTHTYLIKTKDDVLLQESTLYFPGWNVYDNEEIIPVQPGNEGIISFKIKKGLHYIIVKYQDIQIYKILKEISLITFVVIILTIFIGFTNKFTKLYRH